MLGVGVDSTTAERSFRVGSIYTQRGQVSAVCFQVALTAPRWKEGKARRGRVLFVGRAGLRTSCDGC